MNNFVNEFNCIRMRTGPDIMIRIAHYEKNMKK